MQHVIVQTKLQSIIVRRMLEEQVIRCPFHLIHFPHTSEPSSKPYMSGLIAVADRVTEKARPKHGFLFFFTYFFCLMARCQLRRESIFMANVNWYHFGLALKFFPGLRITTFDDGTANFQKNSAYFSNGALSLNSVRGRIAQKLFPVGAARFIRSRIDTHYTIYPHVENIVARSRIVALKIDWADLIDSNDLTRLPANVRRILVGTVYAEAVNVWKIKLSEQQILEAIEWADLYIPHPRQKDDVPVDSLLSKYTAESLISHYSAKSDIIVAHFNSSAIVSFSTDPRVRLIDLSKNERLPDVSFQKR